MSSRSRTALIIGAAGDIGRVIVSRLSGEGYKVAISDMESCRKTLDEIAETITKAGGKVFVVTGDARKEQDVQTIVQETVNHLGPLEVLVVAAGKFFGRPITELTVDEWDDLMDSNAKVMMLCYKTAANQMIKQKQENDNGAHYRIIGVASVAGLTGANLCAPYAAAKFAVRGLTQATASDLAPHNITANSIAVGFVGGTKMLRILEEVVEETYGLPEGGWQSAAVKSIKLGRLGKPQHVAHVVSFLAAEDAEWITGQMVTVDGGMFVA